MRNKGLYRPEFEHDACGIGFAAHINGERSRSIVEQALTMLARLDHRAGHHDDTSDGAGMLTQIPDHFFRDQVSFDLPDFEDYGVGMLFLPQEQAIKRHVIKIIETEVKRLSLQLLGWRDVPIDPEILGKQSKKSCPDIKQLFIANHHDFDPVSFDRQLYVLRKRIEKQCQAFQGFYVASLSARTIVYKGLIHSADLALFYLDLASPTFKSAFSLVHSRFSTNTFPSWERAHPYRTLIHNGEINTLRGNINAMRAREKSLVIGNFGVPTDEFLPIIDENGSDSVALDNVLEFLTLSGIPLAQAVAMLVPEPWEDGNLDEETAAFYEYYSALMEPWDGPMAIAFTDGKMIGAKLDRNGLRPGRYVVTKEQHLLFASEFGAVDLAPEDIVQKKLLAPGEMFGIDVNKGKLLSDRELKQAFIEGKTYRKWLDENVIDLPDSSEVDIFIDGLRLKQKVFGYTYEDLHKGLKPMVTEGKDPVGSMGMDAPLAVLSERPQLLYNYFKQWFAQVTNPPIDAIRETYVTSMTTWLGSKGSLFCQVPNGGPRVKLGTPFLDASQLKQVEAGCSGRFRVRRLPIIFPVKDGARGLKAAMDTLFHQADEAIRAGCAFLILSDRDVDAHHAAIPALLAVSGLNHHLIRSGKRLEVSLIIDTGEARDGHQMATLIGYGADAIHPYLGLASIVDLVRHGHIKDLSAEKASQIYLKTLKDCVVKIMSKMGISTMQSYRGAQTFEAIGLSDAVIDRYFPGTVSQIGGLTLDEMAEEILRRHQTAFRRSRDREETGLDSGSVLQWRHGGEKHRPSPNALYLLQQAARLGDVKIYERFAQCVDEDDFSNIRSLFCFDSGRQPIPIDQVESIEAITRRFKTGAMSYGALSQEAHEALAIAMNRLGGKSNSGEGGEDPDRYHADENGDLRRSAIKQVASGRFGVTSHYLVNADEIQIKMAQGAKPGEGGQLPDTKVYPWIAEVRGSTVGVGLISPPPHHDIYSIEDLAQLIYDLKRANPKARISVKLVAKSGVGTIAAGVAKGLADVILISGHDGGTGASPRASIEHAGCPWELGLAEVHQTLMVNGLRSRVVLEADGKLMTGRDVIIAACLGAEEFGFSTAPLIALGCVVMRACHLDTCPVGIATQNPELRKRMTGSPDHVVNYLRFVAEDVRGWLARLGYHSIAELIGETRLLKIKPTLRSHWKAKHLDLSRLLSYSGPILVKTAQNHELEKTFDHRVLLSACEPAITNRENIFLSARVRNTDRAIGTLIGSLVTEKWGADGLFDHTIRLRLSGSAGQSLGAFIPKGITIDLEGDANDYVGKGLSGGRIVIKPSVQLSHVESQALIGNVAFYGATSGEAFISGYAGQRFAVRNSGANLVVEGVGDHGCEYMTGGRVVVLGPIGRNFAAGMSGGVAYIWTDSLADVHPKINLEMVEVGPLQSVDESELKALLTRHQALTGSTKAREVLDNWKNNAARFIKVLPVDFGKMLAAIERLKAAGLTEAEAKLTAFNRKKQGLALVPDDLIVNGSLSIV
ncbi:glutamate synthase large subunit [Camelliibacillus cellulosilyticus]|uniref:Glutamate synthase large subunit n=1 Tax=Camelliibacillus cellulosilyticus TaxID=2174486 RepID=A0ABV9GNE5_9BACL